MGIPGLINAIGAGERISLAKLAINHLERTARPIRIAVDISIWLFQVQAGRGGRNPELRTLFYRLLKFLALPVHPLFVYDGRQKPPFKRGKAVNSRSYGNAPIIGLSKTLIRLFKFPIHDAPGEAEAECARLQRAGIVDAVMSNDVDALMFGSTFTVMNYSKENGSGTSAATHVTCYRMDTSSQASTSTVVLDRAGMILFAMLSGGDYLPSGVPKCGSKLAAEIARAGFGADLLEALDSDGPKLESQLREWRERLQYELDENESGYFQTMHKAVRIPDDFPSREILSFYAAPIVSNDAEVHLLRRRLKHAWDQEIDTLDVRQFTADAFEWNYRSGARKVVRLLAEPLVSHRLRLRRPVLAFGAPLLSDNQTPVLDKIFKSRASFSTDGQTELQVDMIPIDVVGIDLMEEEPNPPMPSLEAEEPNDEEDEQEQSAEPAASAATKTRVTKRYDPYLPEKVWVFEAVAAIGMPKIVDKWRAEQVEKAEKALAPKPAATRKAGPKKKGPIDSGMRHGSILKYGTLSKPGSGMSAPKKAQLLEAAFSSSATITSSPVHSSQGSSSSQRNQRSMTTSREQGYQQHLPLTGHSEYNDLDGVLDRFSTSCRISQKLETRRRQVGTVAPLSAGRLRVSNNGVDLATMVAVPVESSTSSSPLVRAGGLRLSYQLGRTDPQNLSCVAGADGSSDREFGADVPLIKSLTTPPSRLRARELRLSYSPSSDSRQGRKPRQTSATSSSPHSNSNQEGTACTSPESPELISNYARTGVIRLDELARHSKHRTWSSDPDGDLETSSVASLESERSPPVRARSGWLRVSYSSVPYAGPSAADREIAAANAGLSGQQPARADVQRQSARSPGRPASIRPFAEAPSIVDLDSALSSLSLREGTGAYDGRESRAMKTVNMRRKSPKMVPAVIATHESISPPSGDRQGSKASSTALGSAKGADAPRKSARTSKRAPKPSVPDVPRPDRVLSPVSQAQASTDHEPKNGHKPTTRHIENVTVLDGTWFADSKTISIDSDTTFHIGGDEKKIAPERRADVETRNQQGEDSKQKTEKKTATKKKIARVSVLDMT